MTKNPVFTWMKQMKDMSVFFFNKGMKTLKTMDQTC